MILFGITLAFVPNVAFASFSPSPGHLVVFNDLVLDGGQCTGRVSMFYALLAVDEESLFNASITSSCGLVIDELQEANPENIDPVGEITIFTSIGGWQGINVEPWNFNLDSEFGLGIVGCPTGIASVASSTSPGAIPNSATPTFYNDWSQQGCRSGYTMGWHYLDTPTYAVLTHNTTSTGVYECNAWLGEDRDPWGDVGCSARGGTTPIADLYNGIRYRIGEVSSGASADYEIRS